MTHIKLPRCPKGWRRREIGETIQPTDKAWNKAESKVLLIFLTSCAGLQVRATDHNFYYCKI
jgi:hypothetical protein